MSARGESGLSPKRSDRLPATDVARRACGARRPRSSAGSGVTWYTWLEQGRDVSISPSALARLAVALRLGRAERAYLFELADRRDPDQGGKDVGAVPPAALACLTVINSPAYVLDRAWNALGWDAHAARLFVGWLDGQGERNLLRYIFLEPAARALIHNYDDRSRRVVAEFRSQVGALLEDAPIRGLIEELRTRSSRFAQLWDEHGVLTRDGGTRAFNHPRDGSLSYEQVTFNLASRPDVKFDRPGGGGTACDFAVSAITVT